MLPGIDIPVTGTSSKGPTATATKYEGSGGLISNVTSFVVSALFCLAIGMLAMILSPLGIVAVTFQEILNEGSSKQGQARRASAGSKSVKQYDSPSTTTLYRALAWRSN